MSLDYSLSSSTKIGRFKDPIISVSTARSMMLHQLTKLYTPPTEQLPLRTALPIVHDLLAITVGYLASQPDSKRFGLDEQHLELFSMSARVNATVDDCAATDFTRGLNSLLERTADNIDLPDLRDALPTIRAILSQAVAFYFAQSPLLNPSLALFVCQDIDTQIKAGSPLHAVLVVTFLRDQILSAICATEAERVDLNRDPGARYFDLIDDRPSDSKCAAKAATFEPLIRTFYPDTPNQLTGAIVPVESDATLLDALVTQHAELVSQPETAMLDLLRVVAAIRTKQTELKWAHGFNTDVRQQNLHLVN